MKIPDSTLIIIIIIIIIMSVLHKGRSFTANSGTKAAVLHKGRSSNANSGTWLQFYKGWIGAVASSCFPHPTAFSIWTDLKRSEKISGAPTWRWVEWIWLTGPSGLHRNSPQGLNISFIRVFDRLRDPEIPVILRPTVSTKYPKYIILVACIFLSFT